MVWKEKLRKPLIKTPEDFTESECTREKGKEGKRSNFNIKKWKMLIWGPQNI